MLFAFWWNSGTVTLVTIGCPDGQILQIGHVMTYDAQPPGVSLAEVALLRDLEEDLLKPEVRGSPDRINHLLADEFIEFRKLRPCFR